MVFMTNKLKLSFSQYLILGKYIKLLVLLFNFLISEDSFSLEIRKKGKKTFIEKA